MKLMALADLHFTDVKPICRAEHEDWYKACNDKIDYLAQLALHEEVDYICVAGDVFDSWRTASYALSICAVQWLYKLRRATKQGKVLTIPGNHDSLGGKIEELKRTPYMLFAEAGIITDVMQGYEGLFSAYLYPEAGIQAHSNPIVLAHKGLWYKEPLYKGDKDDTNVESFVKKLAPECRLLISGDYHKDFVATFGAVTVVNCGSLMRIRADQTEYKPKAHIITYTESDVKVTIHEIPLGVAIRRDYIDNREERPDLLGNISNTFEIDCNFEANFKELIKDDPDKEELLLRFEQLRGK